MNDKNSHSNTNTLIKQGNIKAIINWYKITTTKAKASNKHTSLKPTNNLKQLKKLFNILPPSIIYEKYPYLCLTFVLIYNIILNEKRKEDVFISPD